MPSTSAKQARFMQAVAKNPAFAKKANVPQSVGEKFMNADKRRMKKGSAMPTKPFAKGGDVYDQKAAQYAREAREAKSTDAPVKLNPQEEQAVKDDKARRAAAKAPTTRSTMGQRFAKGGSVDGCAMRGKTRGRMV